MRYLIIACLAVTATFLTSSWKDAAQAAASTQAQQVPNDYVPCPANVVMADGSHACLGLPSYYYASPSPTHHWHRVSWRRVHCY